MGFELGNGTSVALTGLPLTGLPLTGLDGRRPALIIAVFSSSLVGSLIGERARGASPSNFGLAHFEAASFTLLLDGESTWDSWGD